MLTIYYSVTISFITFTYIITHDSWCWSRSRFPSNLVSRSSGILLAAIEYHITHTHREIRRQVKMGARRRRRTGDNNGCSWAEGGQSSSGNEEDGGGGFPSWRAKGLRGEEREGPPTSRAQRRYLAEGKSLRGHPRRLLRSSSGLPYFRVQPRKVVCCPLSVREPLPRRVYPRDE